MDGGRVPTALNHIVAVIGRATAASAPRVNAAVFHFDCVFATAAAAGCEPGSAVHRNSLARSLAFCQRSSGSLARHFFTNRSRFGGVIDCRVEMGGGSVVRM